MNISKFNISLSAASFILGAAILTGCTADDPFGGREGEGELRMRMVINSDVTRADMDNDTEAALRSGCVVYISDPNKGLLHKFQGLENVPESIKMKSGSYVAEAWTGDSVAASFDKKFYRGYQPFEVTQGVSQVVVNCKIANVVASVNSATVDPEFVNDMRITVSNSKGELVFDKDNYDFAKGYFMMPSSDSDLSYTITGSNAEGKPFEKSGIIGNVERAHEYILNFSYNPDYEKLGGSFITVTIDDNEIQVNDEVEMLSRPCVSLVNGDIDRQVVGQPGAFADDLIVKISSFGGVENVKISSMQADELNLPMGDGQEIDITNLTSTAEADVAAAHISYDITYNENRNLATCFLVFSTEFLNKIPEAPEEYIIHLSTQDKYGKSTEKDIRIAVGDQAIKVDDPVVIGNLASLDLLSVGSRRAMIPVAVTSSEASNPGVRYREAGSNGQWQEVRVANPSAVVCKASRKAPADAFVTLTGLKPSTRYEIQAFADGFTSESRYITTESVFTIPNASMEEWSNLSSNSKVVIPGAGGERTFWDSGNHGAAKVNEILTEGSSVMTHSGSFSASLTSKFASVMGIGKFAAGNLFAGEYVGTDGTDGILEFGRQYDGSHPSAMRVWVNYRPQPGVNKKGANDAYIADGVLDQAQIYVALSTEPVEIRTKNSAKLFNKDAACILAYGEKTFTANFGPEGALQQLDIPIEYYNRAKTTKPLYLIIVCSASKYGDYFSGGVGSQMFVDDFELVYE